MRRVGEITYLVLVWLFLAAVITQFFLAGLGSFGAKSFEPHKDFAGVFHLLALLVLLLAIFVRRNRADIILAVVLFVITTAQFSLPETREDAPGVAALHVVNALFIWIVGYHLAMRALLARFRGGTPPAADAPQQP
ncbi:MAG: DUF6220 domain-containing protein [Solirubrobacterales bacterium]